MVHNLSNDTTLSDLAWPFTTISRSFFSEGHSRTFFGIEYLRNDTR